jgi:lysophospholipase L1-like esterase
MERFMPSRAWSALTAISLVVFVAAGAAVMLEVGSFVVLRRVVSYHTWKTHPGETLPEYRQPWGKRLWQEQREVLESSYHPFLQARTKPYDGETIHVDGASIRRTINPRCEPGATLIWVFGDSAVWGLGNPDWTTIPSFLSAAYAKRGLPACVVNYGDDAWTVSQGVIKLVLELKQSPRPPDIVVFMNGCNQMYTPFRITGDPDMEYDYLQYRQSLDDLLSAPRGSWGWLRLTNATTLWKLRRPRPQPVVADPQALAAKIVDSYFKNIRLVHGLGPAYHFRPFFYWQPMPLYGSKRLTTDENRVLDGLQSDIYQQGKRAADRIIPLLQSQLTPGFRFLGDLFDDQRGNVYLDGCHLLPAGNQIVAETMAEDILGTAPVRR